HGDRRGDPELQAVARMGAEGVRVEFAPGLQRCPFCHEAVAVDATDWVACKQCLARHHAACWGESKRCASCEHTTAIGAKDAISPVRASEAAGRAREEPPRAELGHGAFVTAVLSVATLGLHPMIDVERSFTAHCERNEREL